MYDKIDSDNFGLLSVVLRRRNWGEFNLNDERGIFLTLVGDGSPLLSFTGLSLVLVGALAIFLAATGQFLPHDEAFLGMDAEALCVLYDCRIMDFMIHDRVSFGGSLIAVGALYMWLVEFQLKQGQAWAWWALCSSGFVGFGSFLGYLGYGYLDRWHGFASLVLLPIFIGGLVMTAKRAHPLQPGRAILHPSMPFSLRSRSDVGRLLLVLTALGIFGGGATIMTVGITDVFVPQDLRFMQLQEADLNAVSPKLVALIAHDREGFGGGLFATGVAMLFVTWCAAPSRHLWQVLALSGLVGFGTANGIHFVVGYIDFVHLFPAAFGAILMAAGLSLTYPGLDFVRFK